MFGPFSRNPSDDSTAPPVPQTLGDDEWWGFQDKVNDYDRQHPKPREELQARTRAATDRYHKRHLS